MKDPLSDIPDSLQRGAKNSTKVEILEIFASKCTHFSSSPMAKSKSQGRGWQQGAPCKEGAVGRGREDYSNNKSITFYHLDPPLPQGNDLHILPDPPRATVLALWRLSSAMLDVISLLETSEPFKTRADFLFHFFSFASFFLVMHSCIIISVCVHSF